MRKVFTNGDPFQAEKEEPIYGGGDFLRTYVSSQVISLVRRKKGNFVGTRLKHFLARRQLYPAEERFTSKSEKKPNK